MPQFRPRPIRDLSSLEGLTRLAEQFTETSFRNDVAERKAQQEANRRANVSKYMNMLGTVDQEPDIRTRNIKRSQIGLGLRSLG